MNMAAVADCVRQVSNADACKKCLSKDFQVFQVEEDSANICSSHL